MGLKVGTVYLEKYNENWKKMFEEEKRNLEKIFKSIAIKIEHVGSTSVEGLTAKPIIDIMVVINKFEEFEKIKHVFLEEPYSLKLDSDNDEILIRKGSENNRTHFIHVVEKDSERQINTVLFRDYLRKYDDVRKEYEDLKIMLAKKYEKNRKMYTASKNEFIQNIIKRAKENKVV